jgi:hypothetical protein
VWVGHSCPTLLTLLLKLGLPFLFVLGLPVWDGHSCRPKSPSKLKPWPRSALSATTGVLVELIEQGIEARQQKEKAFFPLAERFRAADDPEQVKQLGDQLGRFVFGK